MPFEYHWSVQLLQTYSKIFRPFRLEKKILSSTYFHFKKGNLPKLALELPAVETTERWVRTSIPFPPPPPFAPFPPPFTPPVSLDLPPSGKSSTAGVRWAKFDQILGIWGLDANRIYVGTINNLWGGDTSWVVSNQVLLLCYFAQIENDKLLQR